jgi:Ca2+-binding RTX toxin-like protein
MIHKTIWRVILVALSVLIVISLVSAYAANNTVPVTRLTDQTTTVTANMLKPADCARITVTTIVYCSTAGGVCDGTSASELIIGSPFTDKIQGKGGADCIVGGDGDDDIQGNQASDICIGGPGNDVFRKCETAIQ